MVQRPVRMDCRFSILVRICLAVFMFLEICVRVELQIRVWQRMGKRVLSGERIRFVQTDDVN